MFTGLVEEMGTVLALSKDGIEIKTDWQLNLGDSVAVNGCCLTVATLKPNSFTANIVSETWQKTCLGDLKVGDLVNLERAMGADARFGGHIVQGHVDGVGTIVSKEGEVSISAPKELIRYLVNKGSIAVDGVSLTVKACTDSTFSFAIIPHTAKVTILGRKAVGSRVNLEVDILAKYVERLLDKQK